jgi:hypothetical protein
VTERLRRLLGSSGLAWPAYMGAVLTGVLVAAVTLTLVGRFL